MAEPQSLALALAQPAAPAYGQNNPNFLQQQRALQQQELLAQALLNQGKQQDGTQVINGVAVPQSGLGDLARALTQATGGYVAGRANDKANDLATQAYNAQAAQYGATPMTSPQSNSSALAAALGDSSDAPAPASMTAAQAGAQTDVPASQVGQAVSISDPQNVQGSGVPAQQSAQPTPQISNTPTNAPTVAPQTPFKLDGFSGDQSMQLANSNPAAYAALLENSHHQTDQMLNDKASGITAPIRKTMTVAPLAGDLGKGTVGFDAKGQPTLTPTPGATDIAADATGAGKTGEAVAEAQKTAKVMQSNLPQVLQRFEDMRTASDAAGYGMGNDNEGMGTLQQMHKSRQDTTANANAVLLQRSAQGILPELGPQLQQAGIKGNKFLESISANASGLDMAAPPQAKKLIIDGLEKQYIANMKATNAQLAASGKPAMSDSDIDQMVAQHKAGMTKLDLSNPAAVPAAQPPQAPPITKTIGNVTYVNQNGKWYQQ